jgi:hypothetical protein
MAKWAQKKPNTLSFPEEAQRLNGFTGSVLFFGTSGLGGRTLLLKLEKKLPSSGYHRAWGKPLVRQELPLNWRHEIVLLDDFEIGKRPDGPGSPVVPFPNLPSQCFGLTSGYSLMHALLGWSEVITGSPDLIFQLLGSERITERFYDEVGGRN